MDNKCPVCGEKVENGENGMLEHYTVCKGEKEWCVMYRHCYYDDFNIVTFDSQKEAREYYNSNKMTCYYMGLIEIIDETFEG